MVALHDKSLRKRRENGFELANSPQAMKTMARLAPTLESLGESAGQRTEPVEKGRPSADCRIATRICVYRYRHGTRVVTPRCVFKLEQIARLCSGVPQI